MMAWGISRFFVLPAALSPDEIYTLTGKLYGRSLENIEKIMGKPGESQLSNWYIWKIKHKTTRENYLENVIVCVFEGEICAATWYTEIYSDEVSASSRYDKILKNLSKKLGNPVKDIRGLDSWVEKEQKIMITKMPIKEKGIISVNFFIHRKNFLLPLPEMQ